MRQTLSANKLPRTLACVGFDWRVERSLKATVLLISGYTKEPWSYSEDTTADVLLYEPTHVLATALVRNARAAGSPQVFVSSGKDDDSMSIRLPFGATRLIHCLDHASSLLPKIAAASRQYEPADGLCQRLDDLTRTDGATGIGITADGRRGFLSMRSKHLYWPEALTPKGMVKLMSSDIDLSAVTTPLDATEFRGIEPIGGEALLWGIGVTTSGGRLLRRLPHDTAYRLRRWPDFGVIGRRSADLTLAALLTQRAMSPASLAETSKLPLGLVNDFINACASCGLLDAVQPEQPQPAGHPATANNLQRSVGGVFRRIRDSFAM